MQKPSLRAPFWEHARAHAHTHTRAHTHTTHTHTRAHTHTHEHTCTRTHMHTRARARMHAPCSHACTRTRVSSLACALLCAQAARHAGRAPASRSGMTIPETPSPPPAAAALAAQQPPHGSQLAARLPPSSAAALGLGPGRLVDNSPSKRAPKASRYLAEASTRGGRCNALAFDVRCAVLCLQLCFPALLRVLGGKWGGEGAEWCAPMTYIACW